MKKIIGLAAVLALGITCAAAQSSNEGGIPTSTHIAVHVKGDAVPHLTPGDVQMKESGKPVQVTGLTPVLSMGRGIELAFVIDNSLRGSVGVQLNDIRAFLRDLPPGVTAMVGYMQNGVVHSETPGFTREPEVLLKAIHVPMSVPGGNASPYFCLSDLAKRWPSNDPSRARVVFMITNGVDNYTGVNPLNQDSPYVDEAIHDAQKAGVMVFSLYYGDAGVGGRAASFSGQSYLSKVSEETGGESYYQGTFTPVSFEPFLKQFRGDLSRIFELQFMARSAGLQPVKISSSVKGVKIGAPDQVFVKE